MTVTDGGSSTGLMQRVRDILLAPGRAWPQIAAEPATPIGIFRDYVMVLAAIPAIAGVIVTAFIGFDLGQGVVRLPFASALGAGILQYGFGLALVFAVGWLAALLGPHFGGTGDLVAGLKLAAYAFTPVWISALFSLVPGLGLLSLLGLYSVWLIYVGLPIVMQVPRDRALVFAGALFTAAIAASFVMALVLNAFMPVQIPGAEGG